ncbi:hypothetical protein HAX54_036513 [Datura stramonium]|uniref:Cytochrome P450 n=1 Tax=Datura stramonium TaxID=4076 RepID=A0ABS8VI88_DATST|nr:hypothetical protein [Datura stramonium]
MNLGKGGYETRDIPAISTWDDPNKAVNLRKTFQLELFGLALKQALGKDIESARRNYVTVPREDHQDLVLDIMEDRYKYIRTATGTRKVEKSSEEWKPERFLDGKYDSMELQKTMSFGAGKRVCAGAFLAMTISCTLLQIDTRVRMEPKRRRRRKCCNNGSYYS